jgi:pyrroline-5-carboxylate reductase
MSGGALAPSKPLSIGLAGCGKMGSAMALAWAQSFHVSHIDILDPSSIPESLKDHDKIASFLNATSFMTCAEYWDILVLAVKPQIMDEACGDIAKSLPAELPVLSIAAGKPLSFFIDKFGESQPVIRAMPNTPAAIGKGMSVAIAARSVSKAAKENAHFLLSCLGKTEWIFDENLMDVVTAVSGSGPAYVFYLIEVLAQAGIESGLDEKFAMTLARQTIIGAAALAEDTPDIDAATLRTNVTSPGGTTAAALSVLMDGRLQDLMTNAVVKATARGKELSR